LSTRVSRKEFSSELNVLYVQPTSFYMFVRLLCGRKNHDSHHCVISCSQDFSEESGLERTL
jgi:hypothetical protein